MEEIIKENNNNGQDNINDLQKLDLYLNEIKID